MPKKPSAAVLAQLEEYVSPSGGKLWMAPDGKVFGSAEAAATHIQEHSAEIEAQGFLHHVRDHYAHYLSPAIGDRGLAAQLKRMGQIVTWYLQYKAGGELPQVRAARGPKGKENAPEASKESDDETPLS